MIIHTKDNCHQRRDFGSDKQTHYHCNSHSRRGWSWVFESWQAEAFSGSGKLGLVPDQRNQKLGETRRVPRRARGCLVSGVWVSPLPLYMLPNILVSTCDGPRPARARHFFYILHILYILYILYIPYVYVIHALRRLSPVPFFSGDRPFGVASYSYST